MCIILMNSYKRLITLYNDKTIYFKIKQSFILGIVYKCTQTKLSVRYRKTTSFRNYSK